MRELNPFEAVFAAACLLYRTSNYELARTLFPDSHPSYQEEWTERKMDYNTFERFCRLAFERYGDFAAQWLAMRDPGPDAA